MCHNFLKCHLLNINDLQVVTSKSFFSLLHPLLILDITKEYWRECHSTGHKFQLFYYSFSPPVECTRCSRVLLHTLLSLLIFYIQGKKNAEIIWPQVLSLKVKYCLVKILWSHDFNSLVVSLSFLLSHKGTALHNGHCRKNSSNNLVCSGRKVVMAFICGLQQPPLSVCVHFCRLLQSMFRAGILHITVPFGHFDTHHPFQRFVVVVILLIFFVQ